METPEESSVSALYSTVENVVMIKCARTEEEIRKPGERELPEPSERRSSDEKGSLAWKSTLSLKWRYDYATLLDPTCRVTQVIIYY